MEAPLPTHADVETQDLLTPEKDEPAAPTTISDDTLPPASYWNLLRSHRQYRLFIASYIVTHCGEWFNYVASMTVLESSDSSISQNRHMRISLLIVVRLLPNVLIAPLGGVLADTHDLRVSMFVLDLLGAIVALSFWLAYVLRIPELVYVSTFIQQCLAGLYDPCRTAIVPQLIVKDANYLHKATTLSGVVWSTMAAIGSSLGGLLVASLGVSACFVLDSFSYVLSAWLLWLMKGKFDEAALANKHHSSVSWWNRIVGMTLEGIAYMRASPYGALILLKFSGALMFGASDVMLAAFCENDDTGKLQSKQLGMLFASVGIGAMLGPLASDPCVDMSRLASVQRLCVMSFGVVCLGYVGIGASTTFLVLCLFTMVRASGMAVAWIDSTLLIQKLMPAAILGRICAADTALATLGECISAFYAGLLLDYASFTPNDLAFLQALVSAILLIIWGIYHIQGRGVAVPQKETSEKPSIELTHTESESL